MSAVNRIIIAVALLGAGLIIPAHAEMRKSWQDSAQEAVRVTSRLPDSWYLPEWYKGTAQRMDYAAPTLIDAPQWLLLDCTTRRERWRLSPRTHYSWQKVCRSIWSAETPLPQPE
jgi:hypothetical protein